MHVMVWDQTKDEIRCGIALKSYVTRNRVLICDYTHNITIHIMGGGGQPGEIYYLSALTINLFGIVDLLVTPKK
jgi:hypothetical protein